MSEIKCEFRNHDGKPCQREAQHEGVHDCTDPGYRPVYGVDYAYGYGSLNHKEPSQ